MADRDEFERKGDERGLLPPAAAAEPTAESQAEAGAKSPRDLPEVESPSISPAVSEPVAIEEEAIEPKPEPEIEAAKYSSPEYASLRALVPVTKSTFDNDPPFEPIEIEEPARRMTLKPRHWRAMRLAAAVAIGAGFGAIAGTYFTGGFAESVKVIDVAAQEENKAMQQSLVTMAKELTALKANLEASAKKAEGRTASLEKQISDKINERINERLHRQASAEQVSGETTGSIPAPAIAAPAVIGADVPTPRPAPRLAMAQTARPPIVRDWSVRGAHGGYVYVQGRFGDVYQVVPGAPLPGLGPVESIKRQDGRWVVTTPKGIIVSMHERGPFESRY